MEENSRASKKFRLYRKYFFLRNASSKTWIEILKSILKVPIFSTHFKYNFNYPEYINVFSIETVTTAFILSK